MKSSKNALKKEIKRLQTLITQNCLECSCLQLKEILHCQVTECSLYKDRPTGGRGLYPHIKKLRKDSQLPEAEE